MEKELPSRTHLATAYVRLECCNIPRVQRGFDLRDIQNSAKIRGVREVNWRLADSLQRF